MMSGRLQVLFRGTGLALRSAVSRQGANTSSEARLFSPPSSSSPCSSRPLSTTMAWRGLEEFFDEENFGKDKVRVGREWREEELRLKSNQDLHKLWFVLLKERNMLLTMQHRYNQLCQHMPNEERLDKVDISMENLESVVRERNRAYYELECGHSGEPERHIVEGGMFGLEKAHTQKEHLVPAELNEEYLEKSRRQTRLRYSKAVRDFERKRKEQVFTESRRIKNQQLLRASAVLSRFPKTDPAALEEEFPLVTYDEVSRYFRSKAHGITDFDN